MQELAGRVTLSMRGEKEARIELIKRATALLGTALKQPTAAASTSGKQTTVRNDDVRKCWAQ
jgi:hypothetical protein